MKKLFYLAITLSIFTSCKKELDKPQLPTKPVTIIKPVSPGDAKLLSTLQQTPVNYNPKPQLTTVSVSGTQLNLTYNQNVKLLIDAKRYISAWYVVFREDYASTAFADFDFTTTLAWGATAENWVPDNIKQIDHTVRDTVIGNTKVIKLSFNRTLNFYKKYETNAQAIEKMSALIGKQERIKFLTRYQPDTDTTRYDEAVVDIIYTGAGK
ncbi:hypothetical protein DJ568_16540 [Mucilaginibacter hurinus]|uniref:Uncharacterized protein n=1 Tax=Mucilaginibacter hurinus TaxID=2201324 RepID=A0A367GLK8_9SPHI|nr:hypothetical protein [Mucilaginibacter hurinus]RCH53643.1 hypothetical protein DJ568_16540 [Mucilaginibacter hurinus]